MPLFGRYKYTSFDPKNFTSQMYETRVKLIKICKEYAAGKISEKKARERGYEILIYEFPKEHWRPGRSSDMWDSFFYNDQTGMNLEEWGFFHKLIRDYHGYYTFVHHPQNCIYPPSPRPGEPVIACSVCGQVNIASDGRCWRCNSPLHEE